MILISNALELVITVFIKFLQLERRSLLSVISNVIADICHMQV